MKLLLMGAAAITVLVSIGPRSPCSQTKASAGPDGGDGEPIQSGGGAARAEVVTTANTNATTGEVMVHTWDTDLKTHQPIDATPMTLGSGDHTVQLEPCPLPTDPAGRCSRFYGQAACGYTTASLTTAGSSAAEARTPSGATAGLVARATTRCGARWASTGADPWGLPGWVIIARKPGSSVGAPKRRAPCAMAGDTDILRPVQ